MAHQCLKCGKLFDEGSTVILRGCPECRGMRFFYTQVALGADERKRMLAGTELTLREAIEDLVQKAKDGAVDGEADHWVMTGPAPKPMVVDPRMVPKDLPAAPSALPAATAAGLTVKIPPKVVRAKKKREGPRWDYVAPPTPEPLPEAPPLFSYVGLKTPEAAPAAPIIPAPGVDQIAALPAAPPVKAAPTAPPKPVQSKLPMATEPGLGEAAGLEPVPETIRVAAPGHYVIDVKRLMEDSPVVIQRDGTYLIHLASLFQAGAAKPEPRRR